MKLTKEQSRLQYSENAYIEEHVRLLEDYEIPKMKAVGRLRNCDAYVYETEHVYILRSFQTIVASISKPSRIGVDFLRYVYGYTSCSVHQISKFFHDYKATQIHTYYEIPEKYEKEFDDEIMKEILSNLNS